MEETAAVVRLVGMTSLVYHAPSRSLPFRFGREIAIVAAAFALLFGGLALGLALHGSRAAPEQAVIPVQTQTAP